MKKMTETTRETSISQNSRSASNENPSATEKIEISENIRTTEITNTIEGSPVINKTVYTNKTITTKRIVDTKQGVTSGQPSGFEQLLTAWKKKLETFQERCGMSEEQFGKAIEWGAKMIVIVGTVLTLLTNWLLYYYDCAYYAKGFGIPKEYIKLSTGVTEFVVIAAISVLFLFISIALLVWTIQEIEHGNKKLCGVVFCIFLVILCCACCHFFESCGFKAGLIPSLVIVIVMKNVCYKCKTVNVFVLKATVGTLASVLIALPVSIIESYTEGFMFDASKFWLIGMCLTLLAFMIVVIAEALKYIFTKGKIFITLFITLAFLVGDLSLVFCMITTEAVRAANEKTDFAVFYVEDESNQTNQRYAVVYQTDERIIGVPCELNPDGSMTVDRSDPSYIIISGENVVFYQISTVPYAHSGNENGTKNGIRSTVMNYNGPIGK